MDRLRIIDSHTGGEPTRVVVEGLPDLGPGSVVERLEVVKRDFDRYRTAIIGEPRSPTFAVGAYLLPSDVADHGVIFFNNKGYLGMCGHGTIGLVATLAYLARLSPGAVSLETPVGVVNARLNAEGSISFENVPSYRHEQGVIIRRDSVDIIGDVAYGGNWFFITSHHKTAIARGSQGELGAYAHALAWHLDKQGVRGRDGASIDHLELVGPSIKADARNYVLCPGGEYDRSPCGTGTSAKLACLYEDGKLKEGEIYRVENAITGSVFEGSIRKEGDKLIPTITGRAYVNGETSLIIDPNDPFAWGIP